MDYTIQNRSEEKMMKKLILITLLIFSILLQGCSGLEPAKVEEPVKVKVQLLPFLSYAPLYIAQEEGYFAEQGLEVEFEGLRGAAVYVALTSGEMDVAVSHLAARTLSSIFQGEAIKIVADKGYVDPTGCTVNGLLARSALIESGELSDIEDIVGRKVEYSLGSGQAYYLDMLLHSAGYSLADVEHVDFDSQVLTMEAFKTGAVDLVVESEPWLTRIETAGDAVIWKDIAELLPDFQFGYIIYGTNFLEKDREAGNRFMVAYLKAVQQYNQGKTERNMELMQTFTEMEPELLDQVCWPTFRDNLLINTQSMLDFQDWAIKTGNLDGPLTVEQFWDPSFVEYALETVEK